MEGLWEGATEIQGHHAPPCTCGSAFYLQKGRRVWIPSDIKPEQVTGTKNNNNLAAAKKIRKQMKDKFQPASYPNPREARVIFEQIIIFIITYKVLH